MLAAVPAVARATSYEGPSYNGAGTAPTGSKPESKLWWNDGFWWAVLFHSASGKFRIFKLVGQTWTDTGVVADDRASARADVLWDGTKLYVASHIFKEYSGCGTAPTSGNPTRLYRYSYSAATDSYSLDVGFPVTIQGASVETFVLAKDTAGTLWGTWVQPTGSGCKVYLTHTNGADTTWKAPYQLPGAASVSADDISSAISYSANGQNYVGVMWSNQNTDTDYFARHQDLATDTTWTIESAYGGSNTNLADDHINLKTDAGKIYAAVKTSKTSSADPLNVLLVRTPNASGGGSWTNHVFGRRSDNHTRGIVLLDLSNNKVHMLATADENGGTIYRKQSSLNSISFPTGLGTPFIEDPAAPGTAGDLNNVTSTKQNLNNTTDLVAVAGHGTKKTYWHGYLSVSGNNPPAATGDSVTTPADTPKTITLKGSDAETCNLTFSIVDPPANGALGSITNQACKSGSPNQDQATVEYTPAASFTGSDSFTFKVNDGTSDSNVATISITIGGAVSSTFGNTTPGGSKQTTAADKKRATKFSLGENGNVTDLFMYLDGNGSASSGNQVLRGIVYTDNSGSPDALLCQTQQATIAKGAAAGWVQLPVSGSCSLTAGSYWLGHHVGGTANVLRFYYASVSGAGRVATDAYGDGPSATFGSSSTSHSLSVYAAYTTSGGSANTPPTASNGSATTTADTPVTITLSATDPDAAHCDLIFSIVSGPSNGALGSITNQACTAGTPNQDQATVDYTPAVAFTGSDSFTFRANDGTADSNVATISITVDGGGGSSTFGNTTAGGRKQDTVADRKRVTKFSLGENGNVADLFMYLDGNGAASSGSQAVRGVIYADSGGSPGALRCQTQEVTVAKGQAAGWVQFPISGSCSLTAGDYWLGHHVGATANVLRFYYASVTGAGRVVTDPYADGPVDPWSGSTTSTSHSLSVYGVYIP